MLGAKWRLKADNHKLENESMAEIYNSDGEEITVGLQSSAVCDEAVDAITSGWEGDWS